MTTKLLHISALWWLMLPPVCEVMGSNPRHLLALGRLAKWSVLSKSEKREKMAKGSINRRLVLQKPLEHDLRPKKKSCRAVVNATQWTEQSLRAPEVCGSNPRHQQVLPQQFLTVGILLEKT